METVWIIGAGRFGRLAAKRLEGKFHMVIVDTDENCLGRINGPDRTLKHDDGVQYLTGHLTPGASVSWIIPTLPVHLAWEWSRIKLGKHHLISRVLPEEIDSFLPHPIRGMSSHIYVSHADFICPDNCSEPDEFCSKTKQPRKPDMHQLLESLCFEKYKPLVVKSQQLAPGVGGYRPASLFNLVEKIDQSKGSLLICTACRCHGVITGASWSD